MHACVRACVHACRACVLGVCACVGVGARLAPRGARPRVPRASESRVRGRAGDAGVGPESAASRTGSGTTSRSARSHGLASTLADAAATRAGRLRCRVLTGERSAAAGFAIQRRLTVWWICAATARDTALVLSGLAGVRAAATRAALGRRTFLGCRAARTAELALVRRACVHACVRACVHACRACVLGVCACVGVGARLAPRGARPRVPRASESRVRGRAGDAGVGLVNCSVSCSVACVHTPSLLLLYMYDCV